MRTRQIILAATAIVLALGIPAATAATPGAWGFHGRSTSGYPWNHHPYGGPTTTPTTVAPTTTRPPTTAAPTTTATTRPATTTAPTTTATTTPTKPVSSASTGSNPDPFVASWDVPLGTTATASDSAAAVASVLSQRSTYYDNIQLNETQDAGIPIYDVPAGQATVTVSDPLNGVCAGRGDWTAGKGSAQIPVPAGAEPSTGTDHSLVVFQPSTNTVWEMWMVERSGTGWTSCSVGIMNDVSTDPTGVFSNTPTAHDNGSQLSASGISYLGTAVTNADVASGAVDHTLAMGIVQCTGVTAPARTGANDCPGGTTAIAEGTMFRFPATMAMPAGLTPIGQMIFKAIQNYGIVVTDFSGSVVVAAQYGAQAGSTDAIDPAMAGQAPYQAIDSLPWGSLVKIDPASVAGR